jgi:hypothetical protein
VSVVVHHTKEEFTITYGGDEGSTQNNCESVSFYVDRLCITKPLTPKRNEKNTKRNLVRIYSLK